MSTADPPLVLEKTVETISTEEIGLKRFDNTDKKSKLKIRTSESKQQVSADIPSGPMRIPDCTWEYKYLLVIIDHYTRYTWLSPLLNKDMASNSLKVFKANPKNQSGCRMPACPADRQRRRIHGKRIFEVNSSSWDRTHHLCPYAPSMKSCVERGSRQDGQYLESRARVGPRNSCVQGNSCHAIGDSEYIIDIELHQV